MRIVSVELLPAEQNYFVTKSYNWIRLDITYKQARQPKKNPDSCMFDSIILMSHTTPHHIQMQRRGAETILQLLIGSRSCELRQTLYIFPATRIELNRVTRESGMKMTPF